MSTGSSHAWLTPSPGRCHSFRTHQVSNHCKSSVSSSGAEGQSLHVTYHTLSGIFCIASLHQLGVRTPNRHQKEGSGRWTKLEWKETCCLLRQGQYEWNVQVIMGCGGLVLFAWCHNGGFDSWENGAFVWACQWHYTLLWMLRIAGILPRAFLCVLGLSKIPSSFCLAILFVFAHCSSSYCWGQRTLAECFI